jgi:hypothetical protein
MAEVRARDEALAAIDRGLTQWITAAAGVLAQASAAAEGNRSVADAAVRKCVNKIGAIEVGLASLKQGQDPRPLEQQLRRARQSLQAARQAAAKIDDVGRRLSALQRTCTQRAATLVSEARADLSRRTGELESYRVPDGPVTGGSVNSANAAGRAASSTLATLGLAEVDVESATFTDNPILGDFGRGGATRADYRWAVQTWDEVVRPGVTRGMTREDFERRDYERGAAPLRRTAAVYDMFLGNCDRIRASRRPDGTLEVANGRHRLQIARELGVRSLPGEIGE